MAKLTPTCVWRISPGVVSALDQRFGEPTDAYVNGSQTWLRDDGPAGVAIEWRLHPVAAFKRPAGVDHHELFAAVAYGIASGDTDAVPPADLWDGLEAFPAYGDEVEPAPLRAALTEALGIAPDGSGLVDHGAIGDAWERSQGKISIIDGLLAELHGRP